MPIVKRTVAQPVPTGVTRPVLCSAMRHAADDDGGGGDQADAARDLRIVVAYQRRSRIRSIAPASSGTCLRRLRDGFARHGAIPHPVSARVSRADRE